MPTNADDLSHSPRRSEPFSGELEDRTVLLSGATGSVGQEVARRLLGAGARLAIAVRKPWQVAGLESIAGRGQHLVGVVPSEDGEAAAGFVKGAADSLGPIEVLLSTAGSFTAARIGDDRQGDARALLEANFLSVHNLVRAVVKPMTRRETGNIVLTGAAAAGTASAGIALYAAAKSALHSYAACLAEEVAPHGVHVGLVTPGVVDTPANREAMPDADRSSWLSIERVVDALLAEAVARGPGLRVVEPR